MGGELESGQVASGVLQIILFDLILSGDNAVVIGVVASRLRGRERRLAIVIGGYYCAQLAFRGPDRYAVKLVVGGFLVRLVLLALTLVLLVSVTDIPPARFILWLLAFYFVLVVAEAWMLAREAVSAPEEGTSR